MEELLGEPLLDLGFNLSEKLSKPSEFSDRCVAK